MNRNQLVKIDAQTKILCHLLPYKWITVTTYYKIPLSRKVTCLRRLKVIALCTCLTNNNRISFIAQVQIYLWQRTIQLTQLRPEMLPSLAQFKLRNLVFLVLEILFQLTKLKPLIKTTRSIQLVTPIICNTQLTQQKLKKKSFLNEFKPE
jgi:hypothetical protein